MRTDPRLACENAKELLGWAIVHDLLAHPLMAITNYSATSMRFHNWTSHKAWPRTKPYVLRTPVAIPSKWGVIVATEVAQNCWKIRHPYVGHALVTGADDAVQAVEKAEVWFQDLEDTHGGVFAPMAIDKVTELKEIETAFADMRHAHSSPNWFTEGKHGADRHFYNWYSRGVAAVAKLREKMREETK